MSLAGSERRGFSAYPPGCLTPPDALPYTLPRAMKPGIHCARTRWIRGFIAFQLARRTRNVMLMVPVCPELAG
jgi:hypothetical protein